MSRGILIAGADTGRRQAAKRVGQAIDLGAIAEAYRELGALVERVVVERAGGALTPLDDRFDMLDIARVLAIPARLFHAR